MINRKHKTILKSALNIDRLPVMAQKLKRRIFSNKGHIDSNHYREWLVRNSIPVDRWCEDTDAKLWEETKSFVSSVFKKYEKIKPTLPYDMGGNACIRLLYFITRRYKPQTIVETGVALGFSSQSFLTAMKINGHGRLFSSDFPYFRVENAEKYIGIVVDQNLKENWKLYIKGDDKNLHKIIQQVDTIDLFHYDSDKTYKGRQMGFQKVRGKITDKTIIIFDDIQDTPHFYDFIQAEKFTDWLILENRGGFVGVINARTTPVNG